MATGLVVDAITHLRLAPGYQSAQPAGLGEGNLFRVEAGLAIVATVYVLARASRPAFLLAGLVGLGGLFAVLLYRYVDVPALGAIPAMYEPIWFFEKSLSAIAEGVAGVLGLVGAALLTRRLRQRPRHAEIARSPSR